MKMAVDVVEIKIEDDRGFGPVGNGLRTGLHWAGQMGHYFFYAPRLVLVKTTEDQLNQLKMKVSLNGDGKPKTTGGFLRAIEANYKGAKAGGYWDGGEVTEEVIALLQGKTISERVFAGVTTPNKPFMYPETTKKREPEVWQIAEKDRVFIFGDAEKLGTVQRVGDEVSEIKWDDGSTGNVTNTNLRQIKTEKTEKARKAEVAAKKKADTAAEKPAKAAKVAAKKKPAPKGKAKPAKPSAGRKPKGSGAPEGRIVIKCEGNPRREGTKAGARFADMAKYVGSNPKAQASDVLDKTSYRIDDLNWDIKAKNIEVK